jgi:ribosomal protein S18 acetylase RimI-like enzyme
VQGWSLTVTFFYLFAGSLDYAYPIPNLVHVKQMNIIIRNALVKDCADMARLAAALNAYDGNPTDLFTAEWAKEICFGPKPSLGALVAEIDGYVVGLALYHDSVNTGFGQLGAYLNDLYVEPEYRRLGLGRRLIAKLAASLRARGRTFLWWTVKPKNEDGLAFYRALGAGHELVMAHALGYQSFDQLADEGEK